MKVTHALPPHHNNDCKLCQASAALQSFIERAKAVIELSNYGASDMSALVCGISGVK
jgi:hypothetical protein